MLNGLSEKPLWYLLCLSPFYFNTPGLQLLFQSRECVWSLVPGMKAGCRMSTHPLPVAFPQVRNGLPSVQFVSVHRTTHSEQSTCVEASVCMCACENVCMHGLCVLCLWARVRVCKNACRKAEWRSINSLGRGCIERKTLEKEQEGGEKERLSEI